jgi:hypothetical protein
MSDANDPMKSNPDMVAIKEAAKLYFCSVKGVEGVGIGNRRLRVYVQTKESAVSLPRQFQGIPVEYVVTGEIRLFGNDQEPI